jgi:hypothetical protein
MTLKMSLGHRHRSVHLRPWIPRAYLTFARFPSRQATLTLTAFRYASRAGSCMTLSQRSLGRQPRMLSNTSNTYQRRSLRSTFDSDFEMRTVLRSRQSFIQVPVSATGAAASFFATKRRAACPHWTHRGQSDALTSSDHLLFQLRASIKCSVRHCCRVRLARASDEYMFLTWIPAERQPPGGERAKSSA